MRQGRRCWIAVKFKNHLFRIKIREAVNSEKVHAQGQPTLARLIRGGLKIWENWYDRKKTE